MHDTYVVHAAPGCGVGCGVGSGVGSGDGAGVGIGDGSGVGAGVGKKAPPPTQFWPHFWPLIDLRAHRCQASIDAERKHTPRLRSEKHPSALRLCKRQEHKKNRIEHSHSVVVKIQVDTRE